MTRTGEEVAPEPGADRPKRTWWALVVSLVGGAVLLWGASFWIDLWPENLTVPRPDLLVVGCIVHAIHLYLRSVRMRFVLDPLVAQADGGRRLDPRLLHGSGFFSFVIVTMLPLRLGEFARPMILARSGTKGLELPQVLGATVVERVLDGVLAVAILFLGLATLSPVGADTTVVERLVYARQAGILFGGVFGVAMIVLLIAARTPEGPGRLVRRILGEGGLSDRLVAVADKAGAGLAPLWAWRQGVPFVLCSALFWGVTVLQVWIVMLAMGIQAGPAEAALMLAIIALSIQLPGGPAQVGSFQMGVAMALSLFASPQVVSGPGSAFAAVIYLMTVGGVVAIFPIGAALLAWSRRDTGP